MDRLVDVREKQADRHQHGHRQRHTIRHTHTQTKRETNGLMQLKPIDMWNMLRTWPWFPLPEGVFALQQMLHHPVHVFCISATGNCAARTDTWHGSRDRRCHSTDRALQGSCSFRFLRSMRNLSRYVIFLVEIETSSSFSREQFRNEKIRLRSERSIRLQLMRFEVDCRLFIDDDRVLICFERNRFFSHIEYLSEKILYSMCLCMHAWHCM